MSDEPRKHGPGYPLRQALASDPYLSVEQVTELREWINRDCNTGNFRMVLESHEALRARLDALYDAFEYGVKTGKLPVKQPSGIKL